ncbi:MAG: DUF5717 family protein [Butyrivibrio sp.]|nr:DUF5717 family protein [Butyrivibrio sp.]
MKEQINRYARGVFEYEPPTIEAKESSIYAVIDKNREYTGSLVFFSGNGEKLKGIIYTDNDRVVLKETSFLGERISAEYSVRCAKAMNGDFIEGVFNIVSNGGELAVPYSFRIEAGSHDTSVGTVRNLFDFASLVQTDAEEAAALFEAEDFEDVYIGDDMTLRCIYEGLSKGRDVMVAMEEFLIAVHKKNPINISLPVSSAFFENVNEKFKEIITVERDSWGFTDVRVSTDAPFVLLERNIIRAELFAGNKYDFAYIVDDEMLHDGMNYGEIVFETPAKRAVFSVRISKNMSSAEARAKSELRRLNCELMKLYISFRTHKINISDWMRESLIILESLRELDDSSPFYRLALAQIYISGKNDAKAKELIENVKDEILADSPSKYPIYSYFMYINSLYMKDRAYSRKSAAAVRECYKENEDWRILWALLFMDEELESNKSLKLLRIKEQFNRGCKSPALYIEACNILNEQPVLLRVLNSFEVNVLFFGAKNGILDSRLCERAAGMLVNVKNGSRAHIRLLTEFYRMSGSGIILESLCKLLIRSNCVGEKYLEFYERGIEAELKITKLFEYYVMSRRTDDMSPLPKMLLMYFGYNNSLDYRHKAYLFANIIYNKADSLQVYSSYYPQMELFVREQLLSGHINEQLAYLYRNIVTADMVTAENAEPVSEIYYTYKVHCAALGVRSVIVRHRESSSEREYPLSASEAYIRIYTDEALIMFAGADKSRYCSGVDYSVTRLLDDDAVIRKCLKENPSLIHIKLSDCEKYIRNQKKTVEAAENMITMSRLPEMSRYYRRRLVSAVIEYFYDSYDEEGFESFISNVDTDSLDEKDISRVAEIYIIQGKYQKARELITANSAMQIMPKRLMKLASTLTDDRGDREDEDGAKLAEMCAVCFRNGKYDGNVLGCLARSYNGTVSEMVSLWRAASEAGLDVYELEERIIAQALFTRVCPPEIYDIFESYYSKGPGERIVEAYLAYHSYLYFVREREVAGQIFEMIEVTLEGEKTLAPVCKLALVRYYSDMEELTEFRRSLAQDIVWEMVRRGYVFPFYARLSGKIRLPFDVLDKTMVEYRTDPSHKVVIHYVYEDGERRKSYVAEDMKNVYEGIFVKSFVVFCGESIQYYISEEGADGEKSTKARSVVNRGVSPKKSEGRYEAINDIIASHDAHDGETFRKLIHAYAVTECVAGQLFKPL